MVKITEFEPSEVKTGLIKNEKFDEIIIDFKKNGYLFLKDIFAKIYIAELNEYFLKNYENYFSGVSNKYSTELSKKRFNITIDIKDNFNDSNLFANPIILLVLKKLFSDKFIISDIACVTSLPGASKMKIHRDGIIFKGNQLTPLLPPHAIGLLIPLIPFNENNGTTRFWPKSHINDSVVGDFESDNNFFDANIDIGSCMLVDYRLVHQGNPNISNEIRPLLYINYSAIWYFDQNTYRNQTPILISDSNFKKIPETFKSLFIRRNIYK